MLSTNRPQMDMFTMEVFNRLVPEDHLIVKIDSIINFDFVYEKVKANYQAGGRGSKDPVMHPLCFDGWPGPCAPPCPRRPA